MTIFLRGKRVTGEIIMTTNHKIGGESVRGVKLIPGEEASKDVVSVQFAKREGGFAIEDRGINNVPFFQRLRISYSPELPAKER